MAQSRNQFRAILYQQLMAGVPINYGRVVPIKFENQKFDQPKNAAFLETWMMYGTTKRAALGRTARMVRHIGSFIVSVLVPEDSGVGEQTKLVEAVEAIFAEKQFALADGSYATIFNPKVQHGAISDGLYYTNVIVPFHLDTHGA